MTIPPRVAELGRRALASPPVATGRRVMDRYNAAGGGLLAGGLTYGALFALLPALLLLAAVLGFFVDDAERRRTIVQGIAQTLPPLAGIVDAGLDQLAHGAAGAGTLGLIGLAWGVSRFYGSLDNAFARIFANAPARGFVARTVRGFVSVILLVAIFLAALVLTGIASYLAWQAENRLGIGGSLVWQLVTPLASAALFVVGVGVIYHVVPARRVTLRAVWGPALLVGVALSVLTQAFSFIAPRLIGSAAVFGTFVAVFAAMIWLSTSFQILLVGAAWLRERLGPPAEASAAADGADGS